MTKPPETRPADPNWPTDLVSLASQVSRGQGPFSKEAAAAIFQRLSTALAAKDLAGIGAIFSIAAAPPETFTPTYREVFLWLFIALQDQIVTRRDYHDFSKRFPEFARLGTFCHKDPPSVYDALVLFERMDDDLPRSIRRLEDVSARSELSDDQRHSLSILKAVGSMGTTFLPYLNRFQEATAEFAYDRAAKVDFNGVMQMAPNLGLFCDAKPTGNNGKVTILDYILSRFDRGQRTVVLDVGTGAGNVPLGIEEAVKRARPGVNLRDKLLTIASDVTPERYPSGWDSPNFSDNHPCVQYNLIDAQSIPPEVMKRVDLIMINGVFDVVREPSDIWHRTILGVLTNMAPGSICMIAPCSCPPLGDPCSGIDHGIKMEHIQNPIGGSPSFAIAERLKLAGFKAAAFLRRDFFSVGIYDAKPMTLNEALLLGRLKRMAQSGFLSQTVQSLLFWIQINALVFQKPEVSGSGQLSLSTGQLPQIFNKDIPIE